MKLIVGLGNPGRQYARTRHNAGFRVLDGVAEQLRAPFAREKHHGLVAEAIHAGERVWLVKPLTYMNVSGSCVAAIYRNAPVQLTDLLVVVDDVHLAVGRSRFRPGGSAGGHNGLKSIIESLGMESFARLRIGVGENDAADTLVEHVLGGFSPEERPVIAEAETLAQDAVLRFVAAGIECAMNEFN